MEGNTVEKVSDGEWQVESGTGIFTVRCAHEHQKGDNVHLLVRPMAAEDEANVIQGIVRDVFFQQERFKVTLDEGLYFYLPSAPKVGEKIEVRVKVECLA